LCENFKFKRESLFAQTLNNFVQIKAKALEHRKKTVNQVGRPSTVS